MRVLLDTNILLRSAQSNHALFTPAKHAVLTLLGRSDLVFFCPQNIVEFWNVATRPAAQNGMGLPCSSVLREIAAIEKSLSLLPDIPEVYEVWKQIVSDHKVQGVKVHDARLVAVMKVYSIDALLTFNSSDFQRFTDITTIHPSSLSP